MGEPIVRKDPFLDVLGDIQKQGEKKPPENVDANNLLVSITQRIDQHEAEKYHPPVYEQSKGTMDVNGEKKSFLRVKYDGTKPVPKETLYILRAHSVASRKLSLIAGVLNALEFSNLYLTTSVNDREKLKAAISQLILETENKCNEHLSHTKPLEEKKDLDEFVKKFASTIERTTGISNSDAIENIRKAERYYLATQRPDIFINESVSEDKRNGTLNIVQVDEAFGNKLTVAQRNEFIKIHESNKTNRPIWFKRLEPWEQEWLLKNVPKPDGSKSAAINNDALWRNFESLSMTSAMTHIPGINNARKKKLYLKKQGEAEHKLISESFKASSMVPYDVPKQERKDLVLQNAEQVISRSVSYAKERFEGMPENIRNVLLINKIGPLVYAQSLLSDTAIMGAGDINLTQEQMEAINLLKDQYPYEKNAKCTVICGNDPVNILRIGSAQSGEISKIVKRWEHTDEILNYAKSVQSALSQIRNQLTPEQQSQFALVDALIKELDLMRNDKVPASLMRNFAAYKVAYQELLVETLNGLVVTNCKSAKDRTGGSEIYHDAMLLDYKTNGHLPKYNESTKEHGAYISNFATLFNSQKIQEAGNFNTTGCTGMKDSAKMLCYELQINTEMKGAYKTANCLADLNKPDIFKKGEARESAELKAESKAGVFRETDLDAIKKNYEASLEKLNSNIENMQNKINAATRQLQSHAGNKKVEILLGELKVLQIGLDNCRQDMQKDSNGYAQETPEKISKALKDIEGEYQKNISKLSRSPIMRFADRLRGMESKQHELYKQLKAPDLGVIKADTEKNQEKEEKQARMDIPSGPA